MAKQPYKTNATRGKRKRSAVNLTLSPESVRILAKLAKERGLTRSRLVDTLIRSTGVVP